MKRPWRKVVHISSIHTGVHGGLSWFLSLECGHYKSVSVPRFDAAAALGLIISTGSAESERAARARYHRQQRGAPHKVRCLICKEPKSEEADHP